MYDTALAARAAALENVPGEIAPNTRVIVAIVRDEIAANSDNTPGRPFFYCPVPALGILHPHGTTVETLTFARK